MITARRRAGRQQRSAVAVTRGRRHRRAQWALVAVAAVGLVAAACSSTASTSAPASSPAHVGSAARATGAPIDVGAICYCSSAGGGLAGVFQPGLDVYRAWVRTVNAAGGIDGHPVDLIALNDGGDPSTSLSDAQQLIADHVVAIADMTTVDQAWASTVQAAGIPVVGVLTYNETFGSNPDFYPEAETNAAAVHAVVATAKAAGAHSLANIYCDDAPVCQQSVPVFQQTGRQLGVAVTYDAAISATAPNYTAQCLAAEQQHVQAVFVGETADTTVAFAKSCAQQGYEPLYVTEGAGFGMNVATAPGLRDHLWSEFPSLPFFATTPAVRQAVAAIDRAYPGLVADATAFSQQDFMAWPSGVLLEQAIEAGGLTPSATPSAAEVVRGLDALHDDSVDGLTPPLTFTSGQAHQVSCWFTVRVQGGKPALVDGGKLHCA